MARKAGIDLNTMFDAIRASAGNSFAWETVFPLVFNQNFDPGNGRLQQEMWYQLTKFDRICNGTCLQGHGLGLQAGQRFKRSPSTPFFS